MVSSIGGIIMNTAKDKAAKKKVAEKSLKSGPLKQRKSKWAWH